MITMDKHFGLTDEQVEIQKRRGLSNIGIKPPSKTILQIITSNLFTYFNFIFAVIAVLLLSVESYRDLTFLPIIIINVLIGIIQEIKAKKVLDRLTMINTPFSLAIRNGKEIKVPINELVKDDIVIFKAGNQIIADSIIENGEVTVNESLLTGEADEVHKKQGDTLMSGTYIVSGECIAKLDKVGKESYVSKLTLEAKTTNKDEQSEIIRTLNKIVKFIGVIIIPIGITLFYQQYIIQGESAKTSIQAMVAAILGMIPEGLFLLASVTLVISATKLAKEKILLHDMKSIETLARVDTLCVDKTGTITDGTMKVVDLYLLIKEEKPKEIESLICDFVYSHSTDNITMKALKEYFIQPTGRKALSVCGFSSTFKYSGTEFETESVILGAPEIVLKDKFYKYKEKIEEYSKQGYRVLVFGKYAGILDGTELKGEVIPYCLIILSNPIRENAQETFNYFYNQGVDIKVISGDNPVTVSNIAKQANIKNYDNYIDCTTLLDDISIENAVKKYTIFGRVTPEQKRTIVRALKKQGKTVAMTGDGVNDILALKEADCSIAMASGSDAAVQASQLILLESDFSKMPNIVNEGRRIVNNLERAGSLFLVKNIFSILTSILSICFGITYPINPSQISLISMFTIGVPAFLLSQIPNKDIIRGNFAKNIISKALSGGITDTIIVAIMVIVGMYFNTNQSDISTASTVLLAIVGMMVVFNISRPLNKYRFGIFISCSLGLIFSMIFLRDLFGLTRNMSIEAILLCINFSIMTEPILRYTTKLVDHMKKVIKEKY